MSLAMLVGAVVVMVGFGLYVRSRIRLVADQYGTLITNREYRKI
jgi:hypothetical protein